MSKAALGQNGARMGSAAYFSSLNSGILLSSYLPDPGGYGYRAALEDLSVVAREIIKEIYDDLQEHQSILRQVSSQQRNRLSELVNVLSSLCAMASPDTGAAQECQSMLSLSGFVGMPRSMASDSELTRAAEVIRTGGESGLDSFSRVSTARDAAQWSESFAAGADELKRAFLQELRREQGSAFFSDAWDFYNYRANPSEYCGRNGCEFCSDAYTAELEKRLFSRAMVSSFFQADYAQTILGELQEILRQIETDVSSARSENDYLTDEEGARLSAAVDELERCGLLGAFSLKHQIGQLCWYTPLDPFKISALQQRLNRLRLGVTLKEDGVYGEKTSAAARQFYDWLANGYFPTVPTVEAAETPVSLLGVPQTMGTIAADYLYPLTQGTINEKYLGLMNPSPEAWTKITKNGNTVRRAATRAGYLRISPQTFQMLKRFAGASKIIKIGGRVLLVAGVALETVEMLSEINADLNDADGKIGSATGRAVGGFVGNMTGVVAQLGIGAAISVAITAGIASAPVVIIGGVVALGVGLVGSPLLESGGEIVGEWIADKMTADVVDISDIMGGAR